MSRYSRWSAFREVGLWIAALPILFPLYLIITIALRPASEPAGSGLRPPPDPTLHNFAQAWSQAGAGTVSFAEALVNSVITTAATVALLVLTAAPAGYVIARRGGRLSGVVFGLFSLGMILPFQLAIVPLYGFMVHTGLYGTRIGLIVIYTALTMPLAIFLYTGFLRGMPEAYEQAARLDGASSPRVFVEIVFPLAAPATGVVAVLAGLVVWNDFFTALVFVGNTDKETLPVAMYSFVGRFATQWPLVFAAAAIALAPVLLFYGLMQRSINRGFASTLRG